MRKLLLLFPALLLGGFLFLFDGFELANAGTDPTCAGNVCSGTANTGGVDVDYWYTLNHNDTSSSLKVRFSAPDFASGSDFPRYQVTVSRAFDSFAVLKNPDPTTFLPPEELVNLTNTQIERFDSSQSGSAPHDFTFDLDYTSLAPGTIDLNIQIIREGSSVNLGPFTLQIDAVSPSNSDEGQDLTAIFGGGYQHCADGVDNDLDYVTDCADSNCIGESIGSGSICEAAETTCNDGLDNDGDGLADCADPQCNGRPGNVAETKFCGFENGGTNNANCADGFDNDGNGKTDCHDDTPGTGCWKTGFQDCEAAENTVLLCDDNIDNDRDSDYLDDIDAFAATGVDCRDYDCAGLGPKCPTNERLKWDSGSGTFIDDQSQCFNGFDDDLDGDIDCSDVDCLGAVDGPQQCAGFEAYLPPSVLGTGDPLPSFYFNFCNDGIDNDGDGNIDAADTDCQIADGRGRFGACGPVSTQENISFNSCSDGSDNDNDGVVDCSDADCSLESIGRRGCFDASCGGAGIDVLNTDAAICSAGELSDRFCGDGFDNDADGLIDCQDPQCVGNNHGPLVLGGFVCSASESGAGACSDGEDNDSDGNIDCMDSGCQDGVQCAQRPAAGWTTASCVTVPNTTAATQIIAGGNVSFAHNDRIHVNDPYTMRFTGSGPITSLTIVIGDAIDPLDAFPFDAGTGNCSISGPSASQLLYSSSDPDVGVIVQREGETLATLDVTLTCTTTSAIPLGPETFPVAYVANRSSVVEFGENTATVQVYENTAPTITAIEVEGEVGGQVDISVGDSIRFQAIPNNDTSGICGCFAEIGGSATGNAPDGNCLFDSADLGQVFANDQAAYALDIHATDGADNESATSSRTINVNVLPVVKDNLTLGVDGNGATVQTYRAGDTMNLTAAFETDTLSDFNSSACNVFVYSKTWAGGLQAASVVPTPVGNELSCIGTWDVTALAAGQYWVFIETTDSSGDTVRSNAQAFLKCETADIGTGDCADADFDNDGTPEGRFTPGSYASPLAPTYPGEPTALPGHVCDNCQNYYNPSQTDKNANGIGDACEAGVVGRCEYKTCSGSGTACTTDADCSDPDRCIVVNQGMCAINCTVDADCTPPTTEFAGVCTLDWGICTGDPSSEGNCCFADSDCSGAAAECEALVAPFIETASGQIYSAGNIQSSEEAPVFNATYCLQASGEITNFTSQFGCSLPSGPGYELPTSERNYVGSFGILDVNGILGGKYGQLQSASALPATLQGNIYHYTSNLTLNSPIEFQNGAGTVRGNGLVIVEGADLIINANMSYQDQNVSDLKNLASIGWIVLESGGTGGNIIINGDVTELVGAYFAENSISTGLSGEQLTMTGMMVAESFSFERDFSSRTSGSEKVDFDARVILNPPPGMTDVTRSLPGFQSIPAQ